MATREHNQPSNAALPSVFYSFGNRCESLCLLQLPVLKVSPERKIKEQDSALASSSISSSFHLTASSLISLELYQGSSLHLWYSRSPSSLLFSLRLSVCLPACLSLGFRLSVPGSGIIAVEINPSDAISPFLSLKTSPPPSTTRGRQSGILFALFHARPPPPRLGPL